MECGFRNANDYFSFIYTISAEQKVYGKGKRSVRVAAFILFKNYEFT